MHPNPILGGAWVSSDPPRPAIRQPDLYPPAQSTWQQGPSYPYYRPSSTWQLGPYYQQPQYRAGSEGGRKPIPLARIKNDEQIIPNIPKVKVERVVDPDSESFAVCCACRQRIFSTPSITFSRGNEKLFLHEQCATLPPRPNISTSFIYTSPFFSSTTSCTNLLILLAITATKLVGLPSISVLTLAAIIDSTCCALCRSRSSTEATTTP